MLAVMAQPLWTTRQFLKRFNIDLPCDLAISFLAVSPRNGEYPSTQTPVRASIAHNNQKAEAKGQSTDEWTNKTWSIRVMERYSAIKRMKD